MRLRPVFSRLASGLSTVAGAAGAVNLSRQPPL